MRFNAITDIDVELLKERSYTEAAEIFVKESTRGNRTIEDVRAATMYGHAAEVYLIPTSIQRLIQHGWKTR